MSQKSPTRKRSPLYTLSSWIESPESSVPQPAPPCTQATRFPCFRAMRRYAFEWLKPLATTERPKGESRTTLQRSVQFAALPEGHAHQHDIALMAQGATFFGQTITPKMCTRVSAQAWEPLTPTRAPHQPTRQQQPASNDKPAGSTQRDHPMYDDRWQMVGAFWDSMRRPRSPSCTTRRKTLARVGRHSEPTSMSRPLRCRPPYGN